jgi:hypothetical protein
MVAATRRCLALGLVSATCLACAPAPRPLPSQALDARALVAPAAAVDRDAALADLDAAIALAAAAYAGVEGADAAPPRHRVDAARRAIAARERWEPDALAAVVASLFAAADGHLAIEARPGHALRLGLARAPAAPARGGAAVELEDGDVPVLTVRSFAAAESSALAALPELARRLRDRPAFVVDLRGNAGGDFGLAEPLALELASGPVRTLRTREVLSIAAAEGRANLVRRRLAEGAIDAGARPRFARVLAALAEEERGLAASPARAEAVREARTVNGHAPRPLPGRAVVLVDRGCASACEMLVAALRQIPGVVIAGDRTRGAMATGEPALFRLPRSGLGLWLGTRAYHDESGAFAELAGYAPDVPLAGPDVLAEARALAARRDLAIARAAR